MSRATDPRARLLRVFAAFRDLQFATPSRALRSASLGACMAVVLILYASVTPALAAAPEKPEATGASAVTATTATLEGTLNPAAPGLPGSFQFSYAPSEALECVGGGVAPLPPAFATGLEKEAVETPVSELQPNREYAFCLTAFSLSAEPSEPSTALSFKTLPAAPSVDAESTSGVSSTAATLEAQVNPNNESTTYSFQYSTEQKAGVLEGAIVTVPASPGGPLEGFGDQTASAPTEPLLPGTTYFYRVLATNATGTTDGTVSETGFTTVATPKTEAATAVTSTTATFHGTLTPLTETPGAEAEYSFDYNQGSEDCTGASTTSVTAAGAGTGTKAVEAEVTGLQPGTTYSVCLVSSNPFGSEVDPSTPQVSFTTLAGPPSIESESSLQVTPEGVTLEASVDPNNQASTCSFEYSTEESKIAEGKGTLVSCASPLGKGGSPVTGTATLTGLELHRQYFYRALAENATHEKTSDPSIEHFETEETTAPSVEPGETKSITETTASLTGKVNPNGAQIKACTFQYGPDTSYGHNVPCSHPDAAEVGAGREPVSVSVPISELKVNVEYHWRLSATSAAGTTTSVDQTFVDDTEPASAPGSCPSEQARAEDRSTGLPDCRAYEMVTPPQKNAALIDSLFAKDSFHPPLIAADGKDIMAASLQCFANPESCTGVRNVEGEPYEFARNSHGWVTHPLAPPATQFDVTTSWGTDADTHMTLFSAPLSPKSPDEFYSREGDTAPVEIGPLSEAFEASTGGNAVNHMEASSLPVEATADLSHVLFKGEAIWNLDGEPSDRDALYEYAPEPGQTRQQGQTRPLPVAVTGAYGHTSLLSECGTDLGGEKANYGDTYGSLSEDGHVVYFTAVGHKNTGICGPGSVAPAANEIYARVDGEDPRAAHTVAISVPTPTFSCKSVNCQDAQGEPQNAEFEGASSDGSRVFFTSTQQLTDNATQSEGGAGKECVKDAGSGCNLYESVCAEPCRTPAEEPAAKERELIDISAGVQNGGPHVQGVMAISSDGSHVYFVARGKLASNAGVTGAEAQEGQDNLYTYSEGEPLRFIATLPATDEKGFGFQGKRSKEWGEEGITLANVTPDGRFLVFLSHGVLTADDTHPQGPAQIYRYDSQTQTIVRVSIGQHGYNDNGNAASPESEPGIAPARDGFLMPIGPGHADPTMSNNGEYVFFQSPVALTPGALSEVKVGEAPEPPDAENVYEYHDGNVYLISDGENTSPNGAAANINTATELIGSDETGSNVFFATNGQLTPEDVDTDRDYYDSRICTSEEPCLAPPAPPVPCSEEACHGAAPLSAPAQAGGSESITARGNLAASPPSPPSGAKPKTAEQIRVEKLSKALKVCRRKHPGHKRAACEKAAHKAFGAKVSAKKSAKRAGNSSRVTR